MKKFLTVLLTVMMAFTTLTFNICAETEEQIVDVNEKQTAEENLVIAVSPVKAEYSVDEEITINITISGNSGSGKFNGQKLPITKYTVTANGKPVTVSLGNEDSLLTGTYKLTLADKKDDFVVKVVANAEAGSLANKSAQTTIKVVEGGITPPPTPPGPPEPPEPPVVITKIDVPTAEKNLVYTGSEIIGVKEGEGYTLTSNKATKAGKYTAVATLEDGYEWNQGPEKDKDKAKNIEWTIEQAEITSVTFVEDKGTYTKDGETPVGPEKADLVVKAGTLTLTADDYDLKDNKSNKEGLHTLKVEAKKDGNFKDGKGNVCKLDYNVVENPYVIKEKDVKVVDPKSVTYNGKKQQDNVEIDGLELVGHEITVGKGPFAKKVWIKDYTVEFSKEGGPVANAANEEDVNGVPNPPERTWTKSIKDAGKYLIKITIDDDSEYTFEGNKKVLELKGENKFEIKKAQITPSLKYATSNYTGFINNPVVLPWAGLFNVEYFYGKEEPKNKVENCIEIGKYTVKVTLTEEAKKNYDLVNKESKPAPDVKFEYEITKVNASAKLVKESVEWNGKNQMPTVNVTANGHKLNNEYYTVKVLIGIYPKLDIYGPETKEVIEPGSYKVKVELTEKGKKLYSFNGKDEVEFIYTVTKKKVNVPNPQRLVYNGKEQSPYKSLPNYLTINTDFQDGLTNSEINAGNYKVGLAIADMKHYEWARTKDEIAEVAVKVVDWSIAKANLKSVELYNQDIYGQKYSRYTYVANKGSDCELLIENLKDYEEGTKFELFKQKGYIWVNVDLELNEDGSFNLTEGTYRISPVADKNHNPARYTEFKIVSTRKEYTIGDKKILKGTKEVTMVCDYDYIEIDNRFYSWDNLKAVTLKDSKGNVTEIIPTNVTYNSTDVTFETKTLAVGNYEVSFHYENGMHVEGNLKVYDNSKPYTPVVTGDN